MQTITAADLFCGAGGTSTGLIEAAKAMGFDLQLLAINHWKIAVDTHKTNYPWVDHLCEDLDNVNPRKVVPGGYLNLLVASPECTHHSRARGGRPKSDQSRASAFHILRWAEALYIENILIENVPEFMTWGPLDENGKAIEKLKGKTYLAFLDTLRSLGYDVQARVVTAADYGDPTTRKRLFIMARRGKPVVWPEPTHVKETYHGMFAPKGGYKPWRSAREIIDWSIPGESIFNRKKPLSPNTLKRIETGLRKYSGLPFVLGQQSCAAPRSVDDPLPTVASAGAISFLEPFIVSMYRTGNTHSIDDPLPAVTAQGGHHFLAQPFLVTTNWGQTNRSQPRSVDEPVPAITGENFIGLCEPFIVQMDMHGETQSLDEPIHTITSADARGLCEPFVIATAHGKDTGRTYPVDSPMPTITGIDAWGVVEPFLVRYNGTGDVVPVTEPIPTLTGKDRFGLVVPLADGSRALVDIRFRMLQPHELAAAMSFPKSYAFMGNREQKVKQIGNAVPVQTAKALCEALLS